MINIFFNTLQKLHLFCRFYAHTTYFRTLDKNTTIIISIQIDKCIYIWLEYISIITRAITITRGGKGSCPLSRRMAPRVFRAVCQRQRMVECTYNISFAEWKSQSRIDCFSQIIFSLLVLCLCINTHGDPINTC